MKNYKPTVEVSVGNPAPEGETYLIFYETGNKIAYRVRVRDAYFGADNKNNFVIKGNGFIQDLKDFNIKSDNIITDSTNNTETSKNKQINAESCGINVGKELIVSGKKITLIADEILLKGEVKIGNTTMVKKEKGEDLTQDVFDYDAVMTVKKFEQFYKKKFYRFFDWVVKSFNEYNKHTHGVAPTDKPVVGNPSTSGKVKESELKDLQKSQNLKVL